MSLMFVIGKYKTEKKNYKKKKVDPYVAFYLRKNS